MASPGTTPSTSPSSSDVPPAAAPPERSAPSGPPAQGWLWAVVGAGYLQASALLLVGLAADVLPSVRGVVGLEVVSAGTHRPWGVAFAAAGLASLLCCVLLLLGHGFALRVLLGVGAAATLGLAVLGSWVVLVVPAAMALALALALLTPALDLLAPERPEVRR